jgi:hypothetical protein
MAYFIFLKFLRSIGEFRKNPHIKIPPKSPCVNFQSLCIFKNPNLFGNNSPQLLAHLAFRPSCGPFLSFLSNRPLPLSPLGLGLSAGPAGPRAGGALPDCHLPHRKTPPAAHYLCIVGCLSYRNCLGIIRFSNQNLLSCCLNGVLEAFSFLPFLSWAETLWPSCLAHLNLRRPHHPYSSCSRRLAAPASSSRRARPHRPSCTHVWFARATPPIGVQCYGGNQAEE